MVSFLPHKDDYVSPVLDYHGIYYTIIEEGKCQAQTTICSKLVCGTTVQDPVPLSAI